MPLKSVYFREDELGSANASRNRRGTTAATAASSSFIQNLTRNKQIMNNYLKSYPYLFVRESDQTDYFCTLCDAFLKEEELQAHLFDGHQAEDCSNYFVRVVADNLGQKK